MAVVELQVRDLYQEAEERLGRKLDAGERAIDLVRNDGLMEDAKVKLTALIEKEKRRAIRAFLRGDVPKMRVTGEMMLVLERLRDAGREAAGEEIERLTPFAGMTPRKVELAEGPWGYTWNALASAWFPNFAWISDPRRRENVDLVYGYFYWYGGATGTIDEAAAALKADRAIIGVSDPDVIEAARDAYQQIPPRVDVGAPSDPEMVLPLGRTEARLLGVSAQGLNREGVEIAMSSMRYQMGNLDRTLDEAFNALKAIPEGARASRYNDRELVAAYEQLRDAGAAAAGAPRLPTSISQRGVDQAYASIKHIAGMANRAGDLEDIDYGYRFLLSHGMRSGSYNTAELDLAYSRLRSDVLRQPAESATARRARRVAGALDYARDNVPSLWKPSQVKAALSVFYPGDVVSEAMKVLEAEGRFVGSRIFPAESLVDTRAEWARRRIFSHQAAYGGTEHAAASYIGSVFPSRMSDLELAARKIKAERMAALHAGSLAGGQFVLPVGGQLRMFDPDLYPLLDFMREKFRGISRRINAAGLAQQRIGGDVPIPALARALDAKVPGALDAASYLVSPAFTGGTGDVFRLRAGLFGKWIYTAVMDKATCSVCADLDGRIFHSWNAIAEGPHAPLPNGGPNPGCYGGGRCRCRAAPYFGELKPGETVAPVTVPGSPLEESEDSLSIRDGNFGDIDGVENYGGSSIVKKGELDGRFVGIKPENGLAQDAIHDAIEPGADLEHEKAAELLSHWFQGYDGVDLRVPGYWIRDVPGEYVVNPDDFEDEWYTRPFGRSGVEHWIKSGGGYFDELDDSQIRAAGLFDAVIGNHDRHGNNYIIDPDGVMWARDNGLAFPSYNGGESPWNGDSFNEYLSRFGPSLSSGERQVLDGMVSNRDAINGQLSSYLTPEESDAMWQRIDKMRDSGELVGPEGDTLTADTHYGYW